MEGSAAFDAADALAALGYGRKESEKAVRSALKDLGADAGSDELLKRSLRYLL
jgi:Holliday junction resolvasome RuvABC DNA-binding subunit